MIYLTGEINEESATAVIKELNAATGDVKLYINSPGGEMEHAFAIFDTIRSMGHMVTTHAIGQCCSAAPLILVAGDIRSAAPNTSWMLHSASLTDLNETLKVAQQHVDLTQSIMNKYATILGQRTGKDKRFWLRIFNSGGDRYFDSTQALEWGIVQGIWKDKSDNSKKKIKD